MSDKAKNNQALAEGVVLLSKASFKTFLQPTMFPEGVNFGTSEEEKASKKAHSENKQSENIFQNAYGETQGYLRGKLDELRMQSKTHFAEQESLAAEIAQAKKIMEVEAVHTRANEYGVYTSAAYDSAESLFHEARARLEEIEKPVALPAKETLDGLMSYTRAADISLHNMKLYKYQLENWDKLPTTTQDHFFKLLSDEHRNEYQQRLVGEYAQAEAAKAKPVSVHAAPPKDDRLNMISEKYSLEDLYGIAPNKETGIDAITGLPRNYKEFASKDSPEFRTLLDTKIFFTDRDIKKTTFLHQEIVDRMMGEFPQVNMTSDEIQAELDQMYEAFAIRTGINAVAGGGGMGLTPYAIKTVGVVAKASLPAAETYLSAQTGLMLGEAALARTLVSQGLKEVAMLVPSSVTNVGTKAVGLTTGLAGGVLAEAPIDIGLSSMFEGNEVKLDDHGLQLPPIAKAEVDEMLRKELYKDMNPLTWLSMKSGYEAAFMHTPEFYLGNHAIPSLSVNVKAYEAGLKGENNDIAERIAHANKLCADLDLHEKMNEKIKDHYFKQEKAAEKPVEKIAAVAPAEIPKPLAENNLNVKN